MKTKLILAIFLSIFLVFPVLSFATAEEDEGLVICSEPNISPDGTRIVFSCNAAYGNVEFWRVNIDGTGLKRLGMGSNPSWSPDGTRIVYHGKGDYIWIMNADGSGQRKIDEGSDPSWFPGTSKIIYSGAIKGTWIVNSDGTGKAKFNNNNLIKHLSPDGTKNLYLDGHEFGEGFFNIIIENIDGTGRKSLTLGDYYDRAPCWSPDGTQIIFSSNRSYQPPGPAGEIRRIWRVNIDGTGLTQITQEPFDNPVYSPGGTKIVAHRDSQIWIMNADGTGQYQLTHFTRFVEGIVPTKFDPDKWNIAWLDQKEGEGYVNCYIGRIEGDPSLGVEGYDVDQIKEETLVMTVRVPATYTYELSPEGPSQILNHYPGFSGKVLKIKFNKFKAIETLKSNAGSLETGNSYELLIRGYTKDGQFFYGAATIQIIGSKK